MSGQTKKRFLRRVGEGERSVTELAETLYKIPALLTTWTRCGKPGCRCTAGQLHGPYHALYWREGGRQRRRYVSARDVPAVSAILQRRQRERATERLALASALRSWRAVSRWVAEYESALREERTAS